MPIWEGSQQKRQLIIPLDITLMGHFLILQPIAIFFSKNKITIAYVLFWYFGFTVFSSWLSDVDI